MDHEDNCETFVVIDNDRRVVELNLERKNNDLEFSAGKRIRIEQYEAFYDLFYDSKMQ